jgi:hypothetical protein
MPGMYSELRDEDLFNKCHPTVLLTAQELNQYLPKHSKTQPNLSCVSTDTDLIFG